MSRIAVVVTVGETADLDAAVQSWQALGFAVTSVLRQIHLVTGTIDSDAVRTLASQPGVSAVEQEREVRASEPSAKG